MALEDMIGSLYQYNMGLPLQYANPYFNFMGSQAGNMTSLGNQFQNNAGGIGQQAVGAYGGMGNNAMNLYGSLANTQAGMYQAELPAQMEMAKYNSLAPVLSGLLGQFGGFGGAGISPISMQFNRPDVMSGYQGAVGNAYGQLGGAVNNAYGQAGNAYGAAHANTNAIGKQFQGQWEGLQNRVFPKAPEVPATPAPQRDLTPPPAPPGAPQVGASPAGFGGFGGGWDDAPRPIPYRRVGRRG